jgi:hypothetical protein
MCIQFVPLLIPMLNCFSNGFQWFLQRSSPLLITTFFSSVSRTLTLTKTIPSFTPFEPRVFYPRLYQLNLGYQDKGDIYPEEMMAHNHILWVRYLVE